ncbi:MULTISPECIES: hypothetical protein [unclassified Streptomyces]|uniref:hypothetical protein n=1 Tax=unclassified Streptomyces TaxID=2593676 RepID=UPI0036E45F40
MNAHSTVENALTAYYDGNREVARAVMANLRAENWREAATVMRRTERITPETGRPKIGPGLLKAALVLDEMADTTEEKSSPAGADATPGATRQADLLTAIRAYGGRWKSGRAVRVLRALGYHPISPGTASGDLKQLAAAGHLVQHEQPGCTFYTLKTRKGDRS